MNATSEKLILDRINSSVNFLTSQNLSDDDIKAELKGLIKYVLDTYSSGVGLLDESVNIYNINEYEKI